jgi:hypothetical protein
MSSLYDFKIDQRVQSHPGTSFWAKGLRYGNVVKIGRKLIWVKYDNWEGRPKRVSPGNLIIVHAEV